ncbi:biopolymer transporter ExbB [Celeribacter litoreus]|uniref:biopolymer transporter ExbB n=1 Tax=Celeribacter litoreus TaxID=2876714 RepID=UPI001CCF30F6|nr:biopolymer transporter ExbB [Celeribacter litoreus]MCA0042750.1 biopolymer transporter ExbB [Celeribacter litoreus]
MDQPDLKAELKYFSQPVRQITLMIIVLGLVGFGLFVALPRVGPVFLANLYLNGFIAIVFIIGILACFLQVVQLVASVNWIERFSGQRPQVSGKKAPRLLAPLAALLRGRGAKSQISATSARSILDSVATRIDEARDITRYISNLLIFLGLLGTFYGLATTVPALVDTIRSLSPEEGADVSDTLGQLMTGLESQLGGMGTAFASSLLGLAGSLVVGMLELFASHGQNRFFRELEEWLSTITRIGFAAESESGEGSVVATILDHMSDQMEGLSDLFARTEAARTAVQTQVGELSDAVSRMMTHLEGDTQTSAVLARVAEGQERLLEQLMVQSQSEAIDAESRMRLRSIDVQLLRILEELSAGRQESMAEVRAEIAGVSRALRELGAKDA